MTQELHPDDPYRAASFDGKVAVVTGGTQGLGLATAELMKARGAAGLLIVGRDRDKGQAAVERLDGDGCRTVFVAADLRSDDAVDEVVARCDTEFGTVDAFVNCAAATWRGTVWNTTAPMWDEMLAMNVKMPARFVTGLAHVMKREGIAGSMVLVGSMAHHGGSPVLWPYSTAKHALETMVRGAAFSLMRHHIRVNVVNPGWMDTPAEHQTQIRFHDAPDDWLVEAERSQPFGRLLKPAEVARCICFLASGESGMLTGTSVDIDQTIPGVGNLPRAELVPEHFSWEDT